LDEYRLVSLIPLLQLNPRLVSVADWQNIDDDEWRKLPLFPILHLPATDGEPDLFWSGLLNINLEGIYVI
jgi:hypothetical protein